MRRILCLHGHGTSADIFQAQTASFRAKLGPDYSFDFVNAPHPSPGAPGIEAIFRNSTTYTWYTHPTPEAICAAHDWVITYTREHGPYEAVCCFSQGCALASTLALYHAHNSPPIEPLPFRAAIFICGGVPLPALADLGLPVSPRAHEINRSTGALLQATAGRLSTFAADPKQIQRGVGLWDHLVESPDLLVRDPARRPDRQDVFGLDFTQFPAWATIRIPTVHIYGSKDPRWPAGIQLAEFCPDRVEYDHGGGHDIPRTTGVSTKIASLVEQVLRRVGEE
ncbi:uncharacterized protein BO97DRAFT_474809 [Aspergillus homomorphus CBS 101889]|uniref:Serine hydrolase domain-containing protein n=1 Tax=Aspergillus homomorphus (strain CBS 101889) TaxID=1450537 RepID=A0A395I955_ASPHC|nr:hypothetical protein BO97DRAFT_474809 [Aspergillus homomorphus CBS 101889]RAL16800.1 hypothetical protein BO97DRAFT_474809 [Aspergillus homomorphus CBS 101889]